MAPPPAPKLPFWEAKANPHSKGFGELYWDDPECQEKARRALRELREERAERPSWLRGLPPPWRERY